MIRFSSATLLAASLVAAIGANPALAKASDFAMFATGGQIRAPKICAIALASKDCAAAQDRALRAAAATRSDRTRPASQEEVGRQQLDALIASFD